MTRAFVTLLVLLVASVVGGGLWLLQPQTTPLIVPGATDIQVESTSWGERRLTYRAPGEPFAWYFAVTGNLRASGWTAPDA